jgi:glucosamine--fructose-6-phosphate aminotransferase (isomerizing)
MSILLSEIYEQPAVLRELLAAEAEHVREIAGRISARDPQYVVIAARGSSDNAARYAQYLFGAQNRLSVVLSTPSLFTQYHAPPRMTGALVIGISQSGASPDLVAVVAEGKRQGCLTLAITNVPDSELACAADEVIALHAGAERSIAATKTYTSELAALALLSAAWGVDGVRWGELEHLPEQVAAVLAALYPAGLNGNAGDGLAPAQPAPARPASTQLADAAELLKCGDRGVVIGRGYHFATAHEIALKAKELAYVAAEPYSSADFLHGPIALLERGFPAIVINTSGLVFDEVQHLLTEVVRRGVQPVVISDRAESLALATAPIALPPGVPEWLSPIAAVVPGQLLAAHLSVARGFDPDHPRGITKVTRTN